MFRKKIVVSIIGLIVISTILLSSWSFAKIPLSIASGYGNHTYIGPFNISNSKTKQAKSKLATDLTKLQSKLEVNLIYQDIQFTLPPETVKFDIDMTLANANSGEDNLIITVVSRAGLETVLNQELPWIQFTENAIDSVAMGIEKDLQSGIMPRNIYLTDYLGTNVVPDELLASSEYSIELLSLGLSKALQTLDKTVIQPFELFSMMELVSSLNEEPLSNEEMTLLSSLLYSAVLQTNFQIDERNISTEVPSTIQPGFEAAINQTLGLDFKFTNLNKTEFIIRADWSAGIIRLSIEGKPFYYTYEPSIMNVETYNTRTIRQYSAFVNDGQVLVSEEGKEGMEVVVQRNILLNGKVINTEDVTKDFYAPIHRVEVHPLTKANASTGESTDGNEVDNGSFENNEVQVDDGESSTETDRSTENGTGKSTESETTTTGTENQNEGKQIYDKSGLPIGGK